MLLWIARFGWVSCDRVTETAITKTIRSSAPVTWAQDPFNSRISQARSWLAYFTCAIALPSRMCPRRRLGPYNAWHDDKVTDKGDFNRSPLSRSEGPDRRLLDKLSLGTQWIPVHISSNLIDSSGWMYAIGMYWPVPVSRRAKSYINHTQAP